ncbi:521_t:CDS:2, partial [Scutellospora calospora]
LISLMARAPKLMRRANGVVGVDWSLAKSSSTADSSMLPLLAEPTLSPRTRGIGDGTRVLALLAVGAGAGNIARSGNRRATCAEQVGKCGTGKGRAAGARRRLGGGSGCGYMRRSGVGDWQTRWLASSEEWIGLMLTEGQQEPVVYASVGACVVVVSVKATKGMAGRAR